LEAKVSKPISERDTLTQFEVSAWFPVALKTDSTRKRKKPFSNGCKCDGYLKLRQSPVGRPVLPLKLRQSPVGQRPQRASPVVASS